MRSLPYRANRSLSRKVYTRMQRARSTRFTVALLIVIAVVLALSLHGYTVRGDWAILRGWVPFLIALALLRVFHLHAIPYLMARSAVDGGGEGIVYTATVEPGTYVEEGDDGSVTTLPVGALRAVTVHADCLVLRQNRALMHIVPRTAFATEEDWRTVVSYLGGESSG